MNNTNLEFSKVITFIADCDCGELVHYATKAKDICEPISETNPPVCLHCGKEWKLKEEKNL
jgi:hypothetical protein